MAPERVPGVVAGCLPALFLSLAAWGVLLAGGVLLARMAGLL